MMKIKLPNYMRRMGIMFKYIRNRTNQIARNVKKGKETLEEFIEQKATPIANLELEKIKPYNNFKAKTNEYKNNIIEAKTKLNNYVSILYNFLN